MKPWVRPGWVVGKPDITPIFDIGSIDGNSPGNQSRESGQESKDFLLRIQRQHSHWRFANRRNSIHTIRLSRMNLKYETKAGLGGPPSSANKSAQAGVGEGPKDGASVVIHHLTKVHGDGKQQDQEEKVDAKQRMQKSTQALWREHMEMHPNERDDREKAEHANNDAR
jgi:hypothetical protein